MVTVTLPEIRKAQPLPETKETALDIQELDIYYGDYHALQNVNLPIKKNAINALIGPSGCGKSTILRSINRMNDDVPGFRAEGTIQYDDVNLLHEEIDTVALRKEIGMVFQNPNPFPKSIAKNIMQPLKEHGLYSKQNLSKKVEENLKQVGLWEEVWDRLHMSAYSLSGGQKQRLCIARTLSIHPEVILLDEPASALDPIAMAKIEDLLLTLKESYTVLLVTHNLQQAARIADYTAFFYQGELVEYADTKQFFSNPKEKRSADYISGRFG
ncbi:phosphate transport system ATP-binding protein [Geomicrobium halophilum]|uniref:Phosphate transport system ATP-binding protein n=1 Tax=Geomicrobium halophilum TaxID=549000 RepID=A0A841PP87_9BACL|nr:phosphate ABC transporter ATP-binding protein PstB [Geomicrobium halophilum]MBB6450647.1 phosphate transport system ATP-binding protein [Geomicrobium halophilum]